MENVCGQQMLFFLGSPFSFLSAVCDLAGLSPSFFIHSQSPWLIISFCLSVSHSHPSPFCSTWICIFSSSLLRFCCLVGRCVSDFLFSCVCVFVSHTSYWTLVINLWPPCSLRIKYSDIKWWDLGKWSGPPSGPRGMRCDIVPISGSKVGIKCCLSPSSTQEAGTVSSVCWESVQIGLDDLFSYQQIIFA